MSLYKKAELPSRSPKSGKTRRKNTRNNKIKENHMVGACVLELAKKFNISIARVYQTLSDKRK